MFTIPHFLKRRHFMRACNFNAGGGAGGSLSANMMDLGEQISLNLFFF